MLFSPFFHSCFLCFGRRRQRLRACGINIIVQLLRTLYHNMLGLSINLYAFFEEIYAPLRVKSAKIDLSRLHAQATPFWHAVTTKERRSKQKLAKILLDISSDLW